MFCEATIRSHFLDEVFKIPVAKGYHEIMSLKIIGAGFGRTGTTSLKAALEQLGFTKCHHMSEVFKAPSTTDLFLAAWRGDEVDWNEVYAGYQATTDWPSCTFYKELMEEYPDAKVLLSVRDAERWYASCRNTIYRANTDVPQWFKFIFKRYDRMQRMASEMIWQGTFDGKFKNKAHAMAVFHKHNQEVIDTVPAEKLLVFEVKQGWEPLCEFLEVPVPDTPFPHLNDGKMMSRFFDTLPYIPWIVGGFIVVLIRYGLIWMQG